MAVSREIPLRMMLSETTKLFRVINSRPSVGFAMLRPADSEVELLIVTNNLMPLHDNNTHPYHFYEAWLTSSHNKVWASVGVFNTDPQGKGLLIYRFDPRQIQGQSLSLFHNIIITAEPQDGNPAPCTKVLA